MGLRRAIDAIATVEAAYDTEKDFESWARGVVESTVPDLDAGLGVVGFVIGASEPGSTLEVGAGALSEGTFEAVHKMNKMTGTHHSLFFRGAQVSTVSELLPGFVAPRPLGPIFETARVRYWDPFGIRDVLGMVTRADANHFFVICVPLPHVTRHAAERRRRLERCAAHIGTALRLRRQPLSEQAVVRPDGVVEHAEGRANEKPALEALRRRAIAIDRARTKLRHRAPEAALSLWKGLLNGDWSLIERFERDGRRYYVACENPPDGRGARLLTRRERQVVELSSGGQSNELAAYTLGLSEASTSLHLNRALKKLGIRTRAELAVLIASQDDQDSKK